MPPLASAARAAEATTAPTIVDRIGRRIVIDAVIARIGATATGIVVRALCEVLYASMIT